MARAQKRGRTPPQGASTPQAELRPCPGLRKAGCVANSMLQPKKNGTGYQKACSLCWAKKSGSKPASTRTPKPAALSADEIGTPSGKDTVEDSTSEKKKAQNVILMGDVLSPKYPMYIRLPLWRKFADIAEAAGQGHLTFYLRDIDKDKRVRAAWLTKREDMQKWNVGHEKLLTAFLKGELGNCEDILSEIHATVDRGAPPPSKLELPTWPKDIYTNSSEEELRHVFDAEYNGLVPQPALTRQTILCSGLQYCRLRMFDDVNDVTNSIRDKDAWLRLVKTELPERIHHLVTFKSLAHVHEVCQKHKRQRPETKEYVVPEWIKKLANGDFDEPLPEPQHQPGGGTGTDAPESSDSPMSDVGATDQEETGEHLEATPDQQAPQQDEEDYFEDDAIDWNALTRDSILD